METHAQRRSAKRTSYACSRCRRQKIKCSGLNPCEKCTQRHQICVFDDANNKVTVTREYLSNLLRKAEGSGSSPKAARSSGNSSPRDDPFEMQSHRDGRRRVSSHTDDTARNSEENGEFMLSVNSVEPEEHDLRNPLTATPSRYLSTPTGKAFFLGASSNWSFSRRALTVTHERVRHAPLPTEGLLFDGYAYDVDLQTQYSMTFDSQSIPCFDHAIYLINTVKFRCCQLFHFFSEDEFMAEMEKFYSNFEKGQFDESGLWYVQFMLLLAFGKSLVQRKNDSRRPSGLQFFVRAAQLLPDVVTLCREPIVSSEILCCMAWYYQALDFRHAAHNLIVQAKSVAMNHGMHTDMSVADLGESVVWRCREIWWTIAVLDGQMTYLMGLPQPSRDDGVSCRMPTNMGSTQRTAACIMQIKLTRIIAEINTGIYGASGRLNKNFVISTRAGLKSIACVADELRMSFPLQLDERCNISRQVAQLHLLYYQISQCIILATRPLLLCCLIKRFEAPTEADTLVTFPKLRNLMQKCVESSEQIVNILDYLRAQDLLESFLPLDLDPLFASTVIILIAHPIDARLVEDQDAWLAKSSAILKEMIDSGNRIATSRKGEVDFLQDLLHEFACGNLSVRYAVNATSRDILRMEVSSVTSVPQDFIQAEVPPSLAQDGSLYNGVDGGDEVEELTAQQIMAMASSLDCGDFGWSFTADVYEPEAL